VEYHANGGGGSWYANRRTSGQLSFEGSWILLLNNKAKQRCVMGVGMCLYAQLVLVLVLVR